MNMTKKLEKLAEETNQTLEIDLNQYDTGRELVLDVKKKITQGGFEKVRYAHTSLRDRDFIHSAFVRDNYSFQFNGSYLFMEVKR